MKKLIYCEKCGKEIDGSYGSGRFCSKSCANSHTRSRISRIKTSEKLKKFYKDKGVKSIFYDGHIRKCEICGKDIPVTPKNYAHYKNIKTCGCSECKGKSRAKNFKDRDAFIKKTRENALKNNFGGFNMHRIKYTVDGKIVDSTYEKILAEDLTRNNIKWTRCNRFKYIDNKGKLHYYTPDFYLPDYNIYLDPKNDYLIDNINPILGYRDIDKVKWVEEQNNIRVIILDKNNLSWSSLKKLI